MDYRLSHAALINELERQTGYFTEPADVGKIGLSLQPDVDLPPLFWDLRWAELSLKGDGIRSIDRLGEQVHLRELVLFTDSVTRLPEGLEGLEKLGSVWIEAPLVELSESFAQVPVRGLNLVGTHLERLPQWMGSMKTLGDLDVDDGLLTDLPASFAGSSIFRLNVSSNRLASIPAVVGEMTKLRGLDANNNKIVRVDADFGGLTDLRSLSLEGHRLRSLPESVLSAPNLKSLNLRGGTLNSLPESLRDASKLERLDLRGNSFRSIPDWITELEGLEPDRAVETYGQSGGLWLSSNNLLSVSPRVREFARDLGDDSNGA